MHQIIRPLALSALASLTLALPSLAGASSVLSYVTTYDEQGFYSTVARLDANQSGMSTALLVPAGLLGFSDASGTDERGKVELTAVTSAVRGVTFDLAGASAVDTTWGSGLVHFEVVGYSDGLQGNGVYPVVLTFTNTVTGQRVDVQGNVVVTNNGE